MPLSDDLSSMLAALGEPLTLAGQPLTGLFDVAGEVVLDGVLTTATTARVPASAGAAQGQTLLRGATSYRVRQVLPEPPDGALHRLVLAKV
jgi:hypothetical protein